MRDKYLDNLLNNQKNIDDVWDVVSIFEKEKKSLRDEEDRVKKELSHLRKEVSALRKEKEVLEESNKKLKNAEKSLRFDIKRFQKARDTIKEEIENMKLARDALVKVIDDGFITITGENNYPFKNNIDIKSIKKIEENLEGIIERFKLDVKEEQILDEEISFPDYVREIEVLGRDDEAIKVSPIKRYYNHADLLFLYKAYKYILKNSCSTEEAKGIKKELEKLKFQNNKLSIEIRDLRNEIILLESMGDSVKESNLKISSKEEYY